jgi:hypothetical protein
MAANRANPSIYNTFGENGTLFMAARGAPPSVVKAKTTPSILAQE